MSRALPASFILDRYTRMGELTATVRNMFARVNKLLALLLGLVTAYLAGTGSPGAGAFMLIAAGTMIAMLTWTKGGIGLPLMPVLVLQHLVAYALPIAIGHEVLQRYSIDFINQAGLEVFVFLAGLAFFWQISMQLFHPAPPIAYALQGIDRQGIKGLTRLGFTLVSCATAFMLLQSLNLASFVFNLLPGGSYPIFWAVLSAASTSGFFLVSMIVGTGDVPAWQRIAFWLLLAANCMLSASGFLLSAAATTIASVTIGFFWSTGRVPWRFTVTVLLALSFLNLGKFTMRDRYWHRGDDELASAPEQSLWELPQYYAEWSAASYDALVGNQPAATHAFETKEPAKGQSLLDRVNNLQNLLFVIDAMEADGIPALHGATYTLIPPLFVPRILWPGEKPRSHEGQVLLNTHFGRQDLRSTFVTYIAWGLLPEAYGNFGRIAGALWLAAVLGVFCAWMENFTARKPVLSAEGFLSFAIFLGLANSYEMVASVMLTSIYQAIVPIAIACAPFVRRMVVQRPEEIEA